MVRVRPAKIQVSVVIPVYRSEKTIRQLTTRLMATLEARGESYEIVLVNDGSPDDSWKILEELHAEHPEHILAVELMRNYGQHNALMCGFRHARGEFVVTMDDDLQNPPEEIHKLLHEIRSKNLDLVYGSYGCKKHHPLRNISSTLVNGFYRTIFRSPVKVTSFRAIRRELLHSIFAYTLNFTFVDGLLAWNTQRIGKVEVEHLPRAEGRSGYSFGKLLVLAVNLFTNFSLIPLQVVTVCGMISAVGGFLVAAYLLLLWLTSNISVPGYASTIVAVLVLGGFQLLAVGVMGEYLGRLHLNVNRKPQYTKRRVLRVDADDSLTHEAESTEHGHILNYASEARRRIGT